MRFILKCVFAAVLVALLIGALIWGGVKLYRWAFSEEQTYADLKEPTEAQMRALERDCAVDCTNKCIAVGKARRKKDAEVRIMSLAQTNTASSAQTNVTTPVQPTAAPKAPKPSAPPAKTKQKKPSTPPKRYEQQMLAASPPDRESLAPWATNELQGNLPAARPPKPVEREKCISHYKGELPDVLSLRIEDYCACAAEKSGRSIDDRMAAEELDAEWRAQRQACYGTRLTKDASTEDTRFFRACESDRGQMFPAYARTPELRKAGFCVCYGSGLSARGYNPNRKDDLSPDVTDETYRECFSKYLPK